MHSSNSNNNLGQDNGKVEKLATTTMFNSQARQALQDTKAKHKCTTFFWAVSPLVASRRAEQTGHNGRWLCGSFLSLRLALAAIEMPGNEAFNRNELSRDMGRGWGRGSGHNMPGGRGRKSTQKAMQGVGLS